MTHKSPITDISRMPCQNAPKLRLTFFHFEQVNLIWPFLNLSTHSCSAFQYLVQNTLFSGKVAHGQKSVNVPVEWQLKLSKLSRRLHFASTRPRRQHVTGRSKPLCCAAHTTVSFSVNELKVEDPLFSVKQCESGKELGRRISELEFVKMLICAKPVQNKQDLVRTLKCCKIKNTEEKPMGVGWEGYFVCICVCYTFSASCDTLSAAL